MNLETFTLSVSNWIFLGFILGIPFVGFLRKVPVYESFVDGAKEGIGIIVNILPYLVGMLVAIGMLRASGAFELLAQALAPMMTKIGMPADLLPLAFIRSFSGGAANGMLADIANTFGGDAYISRLAATMVGSTETTFYVLAIYFGAVHIKRTRHAVPAGLIADFASIVASLLVFRIVFGMI